jgi:hypothetical protein
LNRGLCAAFFAVALLGACETVPAAGVASAPGAVVPTAPIDLGEWRGPDVGAVVQHFQREIAQRYEASATLAAISADLRSNDFSCADNRDTSGRGDPPDQICRRTQAGENCTHTWQVHLFSGQPVRARALYDRRCGGDGLLGGPG